MPDTPVGLVVRKLAKEDGLERVQRFDSVTGERYWASPSTGEPLPKEVAGVQFEGDVPSLIRVPSKYVGAQDWIELVGQRVKHVPGGPVEDPWRSTHTFVQCDSLVLHMIDGDYTYRVVHQPDKYDTETGEPTDNAGDPTTEVHWYFDAELVEG